VSARKVADLVAAMGSCHVFESEVSRVRSELDQEPALFRERPLAAATYPYLWLEPTYEKVRHGGRNVSRRWWWRRGSGDRREGGPGSGGGELPAGAWSTRQAKIRARGSAISATTFLAGEIVDLNAVTEVQQFDPEGPPMCVVIETARRFEVFPVPVGTIAERAAAGVSARSRAGGAWWGLQAGALGWGRRPVDGGLKPAGRGDRR